MTNPLSRREALAVMSAATATLANAAAAAAEQTAAADEAEGGCVLIAQAVEGPFYFDPKLERADITEGRPGAALDLVLTIIESGPCTPIASARVDIWHADASGMYSGYARQGPTGDVSTKGETFLRGTQLTGADGRVKFQTIFPGWYPGRTPHIHIKILLDARTLVTAQIYFHGLLSQRIYGEREPYISRGQSADTTNAADGIFRAAGGEGGGVVLAISGIGDVLTGTLVIAVDRSGQAASSGWGGWLRQKFWRP